MAMNKTKIEYCDVTWNPVTGCKHKCWFCYAAMIAKRYGLYGGSFDPQFHPEKLREPAKVKKPLVIFVCDMGDIFSPGMKLEWIELVKAAADAAPWHTYLWLTKNPNGRASYNNSWIRPNWWLGATITGPEDAWKREVCVGDNVWYSYEPLFGIPSDEYSFPAKQIVIGKATKVAAEYCISWAKRVIEMHPEAKAFVKNNGRWPGAPRDLAWRKP